MNFLNISVSFLLIFIDFWQKSARFVDLNFKDSHNYQDQLKYCHLKWFFLGLNNFWPTWSNLITYFFKFLTFFIQDLIVFLLFWTILFLFYYFLHFLLFFYKIQSRIVQRAKSLLVDEVRNINLHYLIRTSSTNSTYFFHR